jgi:hypothetical protein
MDILVLLLFTGIFCGWGIWVSLRAEERKEGANKKDHQVATRPDTAHESDGSA